MQFPRLIWNFSYSNYSYSIRNKQSLSLVDEK